MYKEYLTQIMENNLSKEQIYSVIDKYSELMEKAMAKIEQIDEELYNEIELSMYELANGENLTNSMATKWVNSMEPYGEKWSIEEVKNVMAKNNLGSDVISYYVLMNMYYNDFYNTIKDNTTMYIELARDKINDVDQPENYLYKEFKIDYCS